MKPVEFQGQDLILAAPIGHDNHAEGAVKIGGLPVRRDVFDGGTPYMESYWRPSDEDMIRLAAGAHIRLVIIGRGHPPVKVEVADCVELP